MVKSQQSKSQDIRGARPIHSASMKNRFIRRKIDVAKSLSLQNPSLMTQPYMQNNYINSGQIPAGIASGPISSSHQNKNIFHVDMSQANHPSNLTSGYIQQNNIAPINGAAKSMFSPHNYLETVNQLSQQPNSGTGQSFVQNQFFINLINNPSTQNPQFITPMGSQHSQQLIKQQQQSFLPTAIKNIPFQRALKSANQKSRSLSYYNQSIPNSSSYNQNTSQKPQKVKYPSYSIYQNTSNKIKQQHTSLLQQRQLQTYQNIQNGSVTNISDQNSMGLTDYNQMSSQQQQNTMIPQNLYGDENQNGLLSNQVNQSYNIPEGQLANIMVNNQNHHETYNDNLYSGIQFQKKDADMSYHYKQSYNREAKKNKQLQQNSSILTGIPKKGVEELRDQLRDARRERKQQFMQLKTQKELLIKLEMKIFKQASNTLAKSLDLKNALHPNLAHLNLQFQQIDQDDNDMVEIQQNSFINQHQEYQYQLDVNQSLTLDQNENALNLVESSQKKEIKFPENVDAANLDEDTKEILNQIRKSRISNKPDKSIQEQLRSNSVEQDRKGKSRSVSPIPDFISVSDIEKLKLVNNKEASSLKEQKKKIKQLRLKLRQKIIKHSRIISKEDPQFDQEKQILNKAYSLMGQLRKRLLTMERKFERGSSKEPQNYNSNKSQYHSSHFQNNQQLQKSQYEMNSNTLDLRYKSKDSREMSNDKFIKLKSGQMISPLRLNPQTIGTENLDSSTLQNQNLSYQDDQYRESSTERMRLKQEALKSLLKPQQINSEQQRKNQLGGSPNKVSLKGSSSNITNTQINMFKRAATLALNNDNDLSKDSSNNQSQYENQKKQNTIKDLEEESQLEEDQDLDEERDDLENDDDLENGEVIQQERANKIRVQELEEKLRIYEKNLRKKTNSCLKNHSLVKDFHFYKNKLGEQLKEKLGLFQQRELFSIQQEIERMRTDNKKLKLDHYRAQQMYMKKYGNDQFIKAINFDKDLIRQQTSFYQEGSSQNTSALE
eukprot:403343494